MRTHLLELRAADGGADAETFAGELAAALTRHATRHGGTVTDTTGGARTIQLRLDRTARAALEPFVGIHRVQRIPTTDRTGRRHTSTVTVTLIGKATVQVHLDASDIDIEPYRASGAGGQHRNKRYTAARVRHVPTGMTVICADHRSFHANRKAAVEELGRRVGRRAEEAAKSDLEETRRSQQDPDQVGARSYTHNAQRDQTIDQTTGRTWRMRDFLKGKIA